MKITSPSFADKQLIPSSYTCDGGNINPPLRLEGVPAQTKSLVLMVDDPDAPAGTWVHWLVWNIDPKISEIAENSKPAGGIEGITSFGRSGYGGPCPPSGTHRYFFKLYALDTTLGLSPSAKAGDLERVMAGHILTQVELIGLYRRST